MWLEKLLMVLAVKACPHEEEAALSFIKSLITLLEKKCELKPMNLFGIITDIYQYVEIKKTVGLVSFASYCVVVSSLHARQVQKGIKRVWIKEYPELKQILFAVPTQLIIMEKEALVFLNNEIRVDFNVWLLVLDNLIKEVKEPNVLLTHLYATLQPYLAIPKSPISEE